MKTLNLIQGSPQWHAERLKHFTASEAQAMMGASKHQTRDQLLRLKKTGITPEVSPKQQALYDEGHRSEALARPIIEKILGDDLFPITGSKTVEGLDLLSSLDGMTMDDSILFEHKAWNKELVKDINEGKINPHYYWQLEQQLLVSGAEKVIFVCSDGTEENMVKMEYKPVRGRAKKLIKHWHQFKEDLASYEVAEEEVAPEIKPIMELPALVVNITGAIQQTNLSEYKERAIAFIEGITTELATDEDFANAENTIKFCDKAEKELEEVKKRALSQTADIDLLFKTVNNLKDSLKSKRLTLNKLVTTRKATIKSSIVSEALEAISNYRLQLSAGLENLALPNQNADFIGAIKGKRTLSSMRDAVNTELANSKIEASDFAEIMRLNLTFINEKASGCRYLFHDLQLIINNPTEGFAAIVENRIAQNETEQAKRLEAEQKEVKPEEPDQITTPSMQASKSVDSTTKKPAFIPLHFSISDNEIKPELLINVIGEKAFASLTHDRAGNEYELKITVERFLIKQGEKK